MVTPWSWTEPAWMMLTAFVPSVVPAPLMSMLRRMILWFVSALTMMPWTPDDRTLPSVPVQSIMISFVIVTAPNPPGSRQLMMPGLAVLEIAPAKVLHGAVRLHGLTSSPTPETQVRVACAWASVVMLTSNRARTRTFFIVDSSLGFVERELSRRALAPPKRFGLGLPIGGKV